MKTTIGMVNRHQNEFKQIKHSLSQNLQLNPYNPDLPTQLFTDAKKRMGIRVCPVTNRQPTHIHHKRWFQSNNKTTKNY